MYIFHKSKDLMQFLSQSKNNGLSIGFVPTMGALHEGHMSLIETSKLTTNLTVCSIFVNPTQFNNPEDLDKYPRTTANDIALLEAHACDVLFLPTVEEMYPNGLSNNKVYDLGIVAAQLEGAFRPGHFQGVAVILDKLLQLVQPDHLFMGQKDYQQCLVVQSLINIENINVNLHIVPTKRAADGLALSSRNARLTEGQRQLANLLYQCLVSIQAQKDNKSFKIVHKECIDLLERKGITPEYIYLCDAETLEILPDFDASRKMVVLIAAYLGEIRLIDNLVI